MKLNYVITLSEKSNQLVLMIALIIGCCFIIAGTFNWEGLGVVLFNSAGFEVNSGDYRKVEMHCDVGKITLSYVANEPVNAFIMYESQYYLYSNASYGGAIVMKNSDYAGTISCWIFENTKLYFIIEYEGSRRANVSKLMIFRER